MIEIVYLNGTPVNTIKTDAIYVDVVKFWKDLKIRVDLAPLPPFTEILTSESEKSFALGQYVTLEDFVQAVSNMNPIAIDAAIQHAISVGLTEAVTTYWASLPEFTPIYKPR
jgi:hypothetical protein